MSKPPLRAVNNQQSHPRDIARQRVAEWRSNADKQQLPVVNVVDSGRPLLQVDSVLNYTDHDARIGRK